MPLSASDSLNCSFISVFCILSANDAPNGSLFLLTIPTLFPHTGPGLAIRVICADEPYICKDFAETNNILKIITDFSASVKKVGIRASLHVFISDGLMHFFEKPETFL